MKNKVGILFLFLACLSLSSCRMSFMTSESGLKETGTGDYRLTDDYGNEGFYMKNNVKEFTMPESVSVIESKSFYYCSNLEKLTLTDNLEEIYDGAFENTPNLIFNEYDNGYYLGTANNPYYALIKPIINQAIDFYAHEDTRIIAYDCFKGATIKNAYFNCNISYLPGGLFEDNVSIRKVVLPNTVETIGDYCFNSCENLYSINLSNNLKTIGQGAFGSCYSLKEIDLPDSLEEIGSWAFYKSGLTSIKLPDKIKRIRSSTFSDCLSLTNVSISRDCEYLGGYAFSGCKSLVSVNFNEVLYEIDHDCFINCSNLLSVKIPNNVQIIRGGAFENCAKLTTVILSNRLRRIPAFIFRNCYSLKTIVVKSKVISILRDALPIKIVGSKIYYLGEGPYTNTIKYIDDSNYGFINGDWYYYTDNGPNETKEGNWWYYGTNDEIIEIVN